MAGRQAGKLAKIEMRTIAIAFLAFGARVELLAQYEPAPIGYATVAGALEALRADPSAQFREQRGWIVVASREGGSPVDC